MKECNLINFLFYYFSFDLNKMVEIVRKTKASTSIENDIKYNSIYFYLFNFFYQSILNIIFNCKFYILF